MEVNSSGHAESVSTDLHALSRGFIPGGIVASSGVETRFIVGYRNPTYKGGIPTPQISLSVKDDAVSKRRNGSVFVCIGGDSSSASAHGSPLTWTRPESVSTDLHALSRGFIPGGIVALSGMETRFIVGYRNLTYKSGIPIPPILVGWG